MRFFGTVTVLLGLVLPGSRVLSAGQAAGGDFARLSVQAAEARQAARVEEAISLYRQALQLQPRWEEGLWYLGTLLYSTDRSRDAATAFKRLLDARSKDDGTGWAFLGLCHFELKEYEEALHAFQQARLNWASDNTQLLTLARYHLGILTNRKGSHQEAYEILRVLAREGRREPAIVAALGAAVLLISELPSELPADRQEVVMMAGNAACAAAQSRKPEAKAAFEEILARNPKEPNVHYALGAFLLEDDADAAMKEFRRELEINPACAYARVQIALYDLQTGEYDAAAGEARRAVELAPKWFMPHQALGQALMQTGWLPDGIRELETARALAPNNPQPHFHLARAYRKSGRTEDATREEAEFKRLDAIDRALRAGGGR